jgi:peptidoglycan/LPS O-acetylase OafA/YrhL
MGRALNPSGTGNHADYLAKRQFGALDGLRCVAIVAVVWHHAHGGTFGWPIARHGYLGVDLFFVLSGFLITTLLLRERARTGAISLRNFYARRTLRIFPPYYAILAGLALLLGFVVPQATMAGPFFRELPWCLTYTSNWVEPTTLLSITWSLAAEEQFYLVWPPIERWLPRHALKILFLLLLANQLVNFGLADGVLKAAFGFVHDERKILEVTFTPILLGVLLAHLLHEERWYRRIAPRVGGRFAAVASLLIVAAACIPGDMSGWPRLVLHLLMTLLLASCVVDERSRVARSLAWRPLQAIGAVSYGMYLLHLFALDVVMRFEVRHGTLLPVVRFLAVLALTFVAALAMYRGFERPILRLKERFKS